MGAEVALDVPSVREGQHRLDLCEITVQSERPLGWLPRVDRDLAGPRSTRDLIDGEPAQARVVHRANGLVLDHGCTVNPRFADALAATYDASPTITDLSSKKCKAVLDAWTNEHTGGLIPESAVTLSFDLHLLWLRGTPATEPSMDNACIYIHPA